MLLGTHRSKTFEHIASMWICPAPFSAYLALKRNWNRVRSYQSHVDEACRVLAERVPCYQAPGIWVHICQASVSVTCESPNPLQPVFLSRPQKNSAPLTMLIVLLVDTYHAFLFSTHSCSLQAINWENILNLVFFPLLWQVRQRRMRFSSHGMYRAIFAPSSRNFSRELHHPWAFWSSRAMVSLKW